MEDYCHSFEHTVELQVIFLQHIYGADIRILPILCGQYARSLYRGGAPEADEGVRRFLRGAGRDGRARRRPAVLDSRHRHGPHGRALSGRFHRRMPTAA